MAEIARKLAALVLGCSCWIGPVCVTRSSLFGFLVLGKVLDHSEAVDTLATLRTKVRGVARQAAEGLARFRGIHGTYQFRESRLEQAVYARFVPAQDSECPQLDIREAIQALAYYAGHANLDAEVLWGHRGSDSEVRVRHW